MIKFMDAKYWPVAYMQSLLYEAGDEEGTICDCKAFRRWIVLGGRAIVL